MQAVEASGLQEGVSEPGEEGTGPSAVGVRPLLQSTHLGSAQVRAEVIASPPLARGRLGQLDS